MSIEKDKSLYYPWFDWLRGVLAVIVMFGHEGLLTWQHSGNFAVQIFFALSGWLIGRILLNLKPNELTTFYFNRAIRIWAPYFLALVLLISVSAFRDPITTKWLEIVFYKASFVYNLFGTPQLLQYMQAMPLQGTGSHFWSVNAEEQFYLIAPLFLVLLRHPIARAQLTWFLIAAFAYWADIYASIVLGVLASVVQRKFKNNDERTCTLYMCAIGLTLTLLAFFSNLGYLKIAPLAAISIVLFLAAPGRRTHVGSIVGGMSYPLYLNHWIGIYVAHAVFKPFNMRDSASAHILSFFLNIALAVSLYWYLDRKLIVSRTTLFTRNRANVVTLASYILICVGIGGGLLITAK